MTLETAAPRLAAALYAIDAELAQFTAERVTVPLSNIMKTGLLTARGSNIS
jgi:hypothetical protein